MKVEEILTNIKTNITLNDIEDFFKEKNIFLPNEYKKFILIFDQSIIKYDNILIKRQLFNRSTQDLYLGNFLSFEEFKENFTYFFETSKEEDLVESSVTVIGRTNGRTSICIGINQNNSGQIFLWDGDFGVTKQANNLKTFFDSLTMDDSTL